MPSSSQYTKCILQPLTPWSTPCNWAGPTRSSLACPYLGRIFSFLDFRFQKTSLSPQKDRLSLIRTSKTVPAILRGWFSPVRETGLAFHPFFFLDDQFYAILQQACAQLCKQGGAGRASQGPKTFMGPGYCFALSGATPSHHPPCTHQACENAAPHRAPHRAQPRPPAYRTDT